MNPQIGRSIGRWLLAVFACVASLTVAILATMFTTILIPRTCVRWADAIHFPVPAGVIVAVLDLLTVATALAIWTVPTVFATCFALRATVPSGWRWGFSICLLLTAVYEWGVWPSASGVAPHIFAVVSGVALIAGIVASYRHAYAPRIHSLANIVGLVVLTAPGWIALAVSPPQPPTARLLWSVTLQKTTGLDMNTQSSFGATRQAVFSGDRILAVFDAGFAGYVGNQPMSKYRLLSLDLKTGTVKGSKEFTGRWGNIPSLYATGDGHAILEDYSLTSLNPDLTPAHSQFTPHRGRVSFISPDGSTMAWETWPGITLLDSHTLKPLGSQLNASVLSSLSTQAVVTGAILWKGKYPNDRFYITLIDKSGQHLIFHSRDDCPGEPEFLSSEKILLNGCGKLRILNLQGRLLRKVPYYGGWGTFAGVSQNGKRFALHRSDERGDFPVLLYEHFIIYDAESLTPISIVRISDLPARQSWSAFSPDGHYFVAGSPDDLSLYELP